MTDQTSCSVDDGLESVQEVCRKADQQRITVIKLCQHKTGDERHNSMTRQRRENNKKHKKMFYIRCLKKHLKTFIPLDIAKVD